jgi:hypothetical protein
MQEEADVPQEGNRIEVRFYAEVADQVSVSVPHCYYGAVGDDGVAFVLILEDMAPAEQGDQIAGCTVAQAHDAVRNIAGLHAPFWCDREILSWDWTSVVTPAIADPLQEYLVRFTEPFIERFGLGPDDAEVLRRSSKGAATWIRGRSERFSAIHTDYRLDNLLFSTDTRTPPVTAIDWTNFAVGLPARDIGFFLCTSLSVTDRREYERDVVTAYGEELTRLGVPEQPSDQLFDDYRWGLFQGVLVTVLGAMAASKPSVRGDEMFRVMATRTCAAIRDLAALDLLGA